MSDKIWINEKNKFILKVITISLCLIGGSLTTINIAKKIIEEQNGDILAYNQDAGAVFEIKLKKYIDESR